MPDRLIPSKAKVYKNKVRINFEADWDYLLEKACTFYERKPYIGTTTGYTYVDYADELTDTFTSSDSWLQIIRKNGHEIYSQRGHGIDLDNRIATRFEWRWEVRSPRHFPRGAKSVIEWNLWERYCEINKLTTPINVVQPEQCWFCCYSGLSYDKVVEHFSKTWGVPRTE